jgi:diguanylate cyclase (GGDEF)-like protein
MAGSLPPTQPTAEPDAIRRAVAEVLPLLATGLGVVTPHGEWVICNEALLRLVERARLKPTAAAIGEGVAPPCGVHHVEDLDRIPWRVEWRLLPSGHWLVEALPIIAPSRSVDGGPSPSEDLDAATGVLSRGALLGRLERWFACRAETPFCLLFLDIDRFKLVNDRFGHVVGDRCLREVAQRLASVVRGADVLGRYGGDEFLLLIAGVTSEADLALVRRRLEVAIARPLEGPGESIVVGLSGGAAFSSEGFLTPEAMIHHADRAMYAMKERGVLRGPA